MRNAIKIDLESGIITLDDGSKKTIDNYILELEDRLIKIHSKLESFEDVIPTKDYIVSGETLFEVMDLLEDRK